MANISTKLTGSLKFLGFKTIFFISIWTNCIECILYDLIKLNRKKYLFSTYYGSSKEALKYWDHSKEQDTICIFQVL